MDIQESFNSAVNDAQRLPKKPSNESLLQLYAWYKQATEGDNDQERPGGFDFKAIAKYDAWANVKGTKKEDAMQKYIELVRQLQNT